MGKSKKKRKGAEKPEQIEMNGRGFKMPRRAKVEAAARKYEESVGQCVEWAKDKKEKRRSLVAAMRKYKLEVYRCKDGSMIHVSTGDDRVKITAPPVEKRESKPEKTARGKYLDKTRKAAKPKREPQAEEAAPAATE